MKFPIFILEANLHIILQHGRGRGLSAYIKSNSDSLQWTTPGMQSSESFISFT